MKDHGTRYNAASAYDQAFETRTWPERIPYISFPQDWEVKLVPPYAGALARFFVKRGDEGVSVYLDGYEHLGYYDGQPYWEVYPYDGDVRRCAMEDVNALLENITGALDSQITEDL